MHSFLTSATTNHIILPLYTIFTTSMCYQTTLDIIRTVGTIGALILSTLAIKYSIRGSNRQILTSKYEEIHELILNLFFQYNSLRFLAKYIEDSIDHENYDEKQQSDIIKDYFEILDRYKKNYDTEELYANTSRLKVLANNYIKSKELKKKILAYNDLFEKIISVALQRQSMLKDIAYKSGFPDEIELRKYVETIEDELIKLVSFGKARITPAEIRKYRDTEFKKKLNLK